ncbi:hypothetical protein RNAN_1180 [Rheinheimera nanhaiensis E407-8]|uniref:Uncharacterized protein n=1 Tax=Rheinheimera nanhaiensis E407-8 TaxID=562729 RepID=I1DVY1_9GAMM|nr:hypothetical protein RNAN_1180 [Rheinheimera nanhaiensis E407-8]
MVISVKPLNVSAACTGKPNNNVKKQMIPFNFITSLFELLQIDIVDYN